MARAMAVRAGAEERTDRTDPPASGRSDAAEHAGGTGGSTAAGCDEPTERHSFNWIAAEYQFANVAQPS